MALWMYAVFGQGELHFFNGSRLEHHEHPKTLALHSSNDPGKHQRETQPSKAKKQGHKTHNLTPFGTVDTKTSNNPFPFQAKKIKEKTAHHFSTFI